MPPPCLRAVLLTLALAATAAAQPATPEQQAKSALEAGRKAYDAGDFAAARERFQEVTAKFGSTPQANAARYGLALVHVNGPQPDYAKAVEALKQPGGDGGFKERPQALLLIGAARRQLGVKEANPPAAQHHFQQAAQAFATARDLLRERDPEASARARCDHAEMLLRTNRLREARGECEPFLKDPALAASKSRPLGLYHHGVACFLDRDIATAGRSLMLLSPFDDPGFGPHAEYLVGRVMHLTGEPGEAAVHYEAVLASYDRLKKDAAERLSQPGPFRGSPAEKARLESLVKSAPDAVAGAAFYAATLLQEAGRVPEALTRFQQFAATYPASPLAADAALRVGFCQVQAGQFADAVQTLAPLLDKPTRLADQVQFQLGLAKLGLADAAPAGERDARRKAATDAMRKAADKAGSMAGQDPDARGRRHDMLLDLADALHASGQFADAAQLYETLWNEQALPTRREDLLLRLAVALGNAGQTDRSQQRCDEFVRLFPRGVHTPSVLLRAAENDYARGFATLKDRSRVAEGQAKFTEAAAKFKEVVEKYPEFERVHLARFGQGACEAQLGRPEAAVKTLDAIPAADRTGDLATTNYLLADCLTRLPSDTPAARDTLARAAGLLEAFVAANPQSPDAPAALLNLGECGRRLGVALADGGERTRWLNRAQAAYERLAKEYPTHSLAGQAVVARAKVRALRGERGPAVNDLRAFQSKPELQGSPVAPVALVQLAVMLRDQHRAAEAVVVLQDARKRYEWSLSSDAERSEWAPMMKYQLGLALADAGRAAEARTELEEVHRTAGDRPLGAEAALRAGRARVAEGQRAAEAGRRALDQAGTSNDKRNAAQQAIDKGRDAVREAANALFDRANHLRDRLPPQDARAEMYYAAAWAWRWHAEENTRRTLDAARKELRRKQVEAAVKTLPPGSPLPDLPPPEIDPAKLPVDPSLTQAFEAYKRLVADFPDTALATHARLEHAELLAARGDHEAVVKLLADARGEGELADRVRLRLGDSLAALGRFADAAAHFTAVASGGKSELASTAADRAGSTYLSANEPVKAIQALKVVTAGESASDRTLLRFGQAHLLAKQYGPARQTFEAVVNRSGPEDTTAVEARFGAAVALQSQGQSDEAAAAFEALASSTGEPSARAQFRVGQCRHAQKRYADAAAAYLVAAAGYDAGPELRSAALLEAARAFADGGQAAQARVLLQKLARDAPAGSVWAEAAADRLAKLP